MSIQFSPVIAARPRSLPGFTSLLHVDLDQLGVTASPVAVLDDFRVPGMPFSPHPHAGFAAVTYVFEDSPGAVHSRASSGADLVVGPGGIVWTHAGSGVVHEEVPAEPGRELHGVQIFVNLSAKNKLTPPRVLHLEPGEVPEWRSDAGDRVRVVVGSYESVASPLVPAEPFILLDVKLHRQISIGLHATYNTIAYVRSGYVVVRADGHQEKVEGGHAVALSGSGGPVTFEAVPPSHFLLLSGAAIDEPVVVQGPFIMNEASQVEAAAARYRTGAMGRLGPVGALRRGFGSGVIIASRRRKNGNPVLTCHCCPHAGRRQPVHLAQCRHGQAGPVRVAHPHVR
jgi:redox-sensitive bicupin YhaK (pirin superfamily)